MAVVVWTEAALDDLDRTLDFLREHSPSTAEEASERMLEAIGLLKSHPLLGRSVEQGLRELIISYGRSGYLALYDFDELADLVTILALRHQKEVSFER